MTVQNITAEYYDLGKGIADLDAACVAASGTAIEFYNDGNVLVVISNGSAGAITATIKSAPDPYGRGGPSDNDNDEAISVPAAKVGLFVFANPGGFNSGGLCSLVLSASASVKVGLFRVTKVL